MFGDSYQDKTALVTGHTGFKGAWLCEWLVLLGAKVIGLALDPPTKPALLDALKLTTRIKDLRQDITDGQRVADIVREVQPDFVFHLAAQSLVRVSYGNPVETFLTNVIGTVNVLDAVRQSERPCSVVIVTTDKCYHNREWLYGYREEDRLGGHDPYSASKACAELVVASYQDSFGSSQTFRICSARAGNVIGGGDWAVDRIVPDCIRALRSGESIAIRNPTQTRPWQHVLEPLSGYLWLGALLTNPQLRGQNDNTLYRSAFNFGPHPEANRTVRELVEEILKHWPGAWHSAVNPDAPHEAGLLSLAIDKAIHRLGWKPVWDFSRAIAETTAWYRRFHQDGCDAASLVREQIEAYTGDARAQEVKWAVTN